MNKGLAALTLGICILLPSSSVAAKLELVRETVLPKELSNAIDLALEDEGSVLFAVMRHGVVRAQWPPRSSLVEWELVMPNRHVRFAAASQSFLAMSSVAHELRWSGRGPFGGLSGTLDIEFIEGIDLHGNALAVLGLQRYDDGMARDGAVGWVARLGVDPVTLKPFVFSAAKPGAPAFDFCAFFGLGGVRFLPDGRLVVVPGAESGILLFDQDLKLVSTWDTEALGVGADCRFDVQRMMMLRANEEARLQYVNGFRTVDAILALASGPALVIREPRGDGTRWKLVLLRTGGTTHSMELPVETSYPFANLHGDSRGNAITLLYTELVPGVGARGGKVIELLLVDDPIAEDRKEQKE